MNVTGTITGTGTGTITITAVVEFDSNDSTAIGTG